ncbi:MAG: phosphoribosylpyrophosphate synthetase [Bacteroidetes bacterium]|nr:phosphoribosylpyrophosphate synthetase [Bacteroidota bacterium]MBS1739569.1 phosphoribosylpyrophosphate synthetase [Bacteroidota bacterium]MBS1776533.1 phosphoribosylpyrophosphate synthetase [Bacteroidota bacterium]
MQASYGTLAETINGLKKDGYTLDFNMHEECLICNGHDANLSPEEFEIDGTYRFEGQSDPDDSAIVYAISSAKYGIKGILVNGYGIYAEDYSSALIEKLKRHHQ